MRTLILVLIVGASVSFASVSRGEYDAEAEILQSLIARLDAQAAEIEELRIRLENAAVPGGPASAETECAGTPKLRRLPVVAEDCWQPACCETEVPPAYRTIKFYADYDGGFAIKPFCPEEQPFALKLNLWTQFRHHAFARDVPSWTDNAGIVRPVRNRSAFDIERARLVFSGYALDERLTYFVHLDGDTDGGHVVDFFDHWWAWSFSDRFQLQLGKRKVPASRQWLLGARRTRFIDRPMACDFLRPDRTVGLFVNGEVGKRGHYEAMVGNGYHDANVPNSGVDDRFTYAATNYFDLYGDFGGQVVDYQHTCEPLVRVGHSFVYSPNAADTAGMPFDETDFVRLTDGTRLTQIGALAPGVTVSGFEVYFYGIDGALKWRGWSVNAEVMYRWIKEIEGNGAVPFTALFQRGFYVEGGRFLIPKKLDLNLRYSNIRGHFGDHSEYAAGLNWYPLESHKMKISFDITNLDGSPLNNSTSDILVGDNGTLVRSQFQAEF